MMGAYSDLFCNMNFFAVVLLISDILSIFAGANHFFL